MEGTAEAMEQNEAESAEISDPDSVPVVVEGAEVTELSVREAVNLAIENNLGVEVARHAPLIAEEDISIAWGAYDPLLDGDFTYLNDREPNTSSFSDSDSIKAKRRVGSAGIGGLVPYLGASLSMDYTASRVKSNTGIASLSPRYDSGLAFGANVPLLKNLVWNEAWTQIEVSGTAHSAELENFRELVMDTVRETVSAYWSLVAEEEQLRVANKSLADRRGIARTNPDPVRSRREVQGGGDSIRSRSRGPRTRCDPRRCLLPQHARSLDRRDLRSSSQTGCATAHPADRQPIRLRYTRRWTRRPRRISR